ncbi:hypothetical protein ACIBL5_37550 [Streptomyces sp. NPDC050516]|uniref:hypothetical protein n=1 Tax=Streptomyces sp. NPDC050516 TaxID=3365621 RepID=UPI0037916377
MIDPQQRFHDSLDVLDWDDFPGLYRRLTPRIVRLLTADRFDHAMIASRLLAAGWGTWPAPERIAVERVRHAWWRSALHAHPGTGYITHILETLSVTAGTLAPPGWPRGPKLAPGRQTCT